MWNTYLKGFKAFLQLEKSLSGNSVAAYLRDVQMLSAFLDEHMPAQALDKITLKDLQAFLQSVHQAEFAAASQARFISGIKAFF
ncbi:MAG: tyrosine recombinase XerD, partial [Sphingobacteriales bacterium]